MAPAYSTIYMYYFAGGLWTRRRRRPKCMYNFPLKLMWNGFNFFAIYIYCGTDSRQDGASQDRSKWRMPNEVKWPVEKGKAVNSQASDVATAVAAAVGLLSITVLHRVYQTKYISVTKFILPMASSTHPTVPSPPQQITLNFSTSLNIVNPETCTKRKASLFWLSGYFYFLLLHGCRGRDRGRGNKNKKVSRWHETMERVRVRSASRCGNKTKTLFPCVTVYTHWQIVLARNARTKINPKWKPQNFIKQRKRKKDHRGECKNKVVEEEEQRVYIYSRVEVEWSWTWTHIQKGKSNKITNEISIFYLRAVRPSINHTPAVD